MKSLPKKNQKNYYLQGNKIVVTNLNEFNITHILECGQVFRYKKFDWGYEVYSKDKMAKIFSNDKEVIIETSDLDYFINYFNLETNYTLIKEKLGKYEVMKPMIEKAYGIRILKQDPFEMIISFIISANNNIKRIQLIIDKICRKFGTMQKDFNYYAFPTREQLLSATVEDFIECGAGYRAKYLYDVVRQLNNFDYDYINKVSSEKALPKILSLSGVGPKVADCILLFGFNKSDVFPVDTWIIKVYNSYFNEKKEENDTKIIRKNLLNIFKELSGYAQQYLFYYKRSLEEVD